MSAATQLLDRALAGDPGAIDAVFQTYQRPVFRLAYATLLDEALAGQAMQAALNSVLGALRQGMSEEDFQVVLFQHVLGACRAERRRIAWEKRLATLGIGRKGEKAAAKPADSVSAMNSAHSDQHGSGQVTYPDAVMRRKMMLWQAIGQLSEEQRVALTLRFEFELPLARIARILRSSPGAVHVRLTAARRVLGEVLDAAQSVSQTVAPSASQSAAPSASQSAAQSAEQSGTQTVVQNSAQDGSTPAKGSERAGGRR